VTSDLDRSLITIRGARKGVNGKVERQFERCFSIDPEELDLAGLTTATEHGVVTVTIPKRPPPPPAPKQYSTAVATRDAGALTSPNYDAAAQMAWPPKFEHTATDSELVYTSALPAALTADNVDVHLERGGQLSVSVKAHVENVKKDDKGNVVHSESRSLHYSTALGVPKGTQPQDVHVNLADGTLKIVVTKHAGEPQHRIKVNNAA